RQRTGLAEPAARCADNGVARLQSQIHDVLRTKPGKLSPGSGMMPSKVQSGLLVRFLSMLRHKALKLVAVARLAQAVHIVGELGLLGFQLPQGLCLVCVESNITRSLWRASRTESVAQPARTVIQQRIQGASPQNIGEGGKAKWPPDDEARDDSEDAER